jgi:hypothetical protein
VTFMQSLTCMLNCSRVENYSSFKKKHKNSRGWLTPAGADSAFGARCIAAF